MTVTTDMIADISDYVVSVDYTLDQFSRFKSWSEKQFAKDDPGLDADEADEAVALLICHRIARKSIGGNVLQSESMTDYSYSVSPALLTSTRWLEEYKAKISSSVPVSENVVPSRGVKRADYQTSTAFKLSEQKLPSMRSDDSSLREPE